jgi:hypothetical protein
MYIFLDYFFLIFHTALIIFNLFGWIWQKTRKANLITLLLTGSSWFILGIFYGIGYCPLTDWHWDVLYKLGKTNLPYSYVTYLFNRLLGIDLNPVFTNYLVVICFAIALICSLGMNFRKNK